MIGFFVPLYLTFVNSGVVVNNAVYVENPFDRFCPVDHVEPLISCVQCVPVAQDVEVLTANKRYLQDQQRISKYIILAVSKHSMDNVIGS